MKRFSMLLLNNNRSKAYLQNIIRCGYKPSSAVVMGDPTKQVKSESLIQTIPGFSSYFDSGKSIYETLDENGIPYAGVPHLDVNTPEVISHIKDMDAAYVIYSGPAGVILRDGILDAGKIFIHAHPGVLPDYKGSTTIYYSMLLRKELGCSVFTMNREIDGGEILLMKTFPVPMLPVDFDMVVDPLVRTDTLLEWLERDDLIPVPNDIGNTFYIVHPVLKHIARIKNLPLNKDNRSE